MLQPQNFVQVESRTHVFVMILLLEPGPIDLQVWVGTLTGLCLHTVIKFATQLPFLLDQELLFLLTGISCLWL